VNYTTPVLSVPIAGRLKMDETVFNAKVMYELKSGSRFHLVGGVRPLTMAPTVRFTGPAGGQLADILHIDTGNVPTSGAGAVDLVDTAVTQSGSVFTLAFHWAEK
jgi:hypothetical protein